VIDKLEVVYDILRIPHFLHIKQDVACTSILVVLVHLGYLGGLFWTLGLIDAYAVYPQVLHFRDNHESLDIFEFIWMYYHLPVYTIYFAVISRYRGAPCVGNYVEVFYSVGGVPRVEDEKVLVDSAKKS
jgi:hypothetical protein